MRHYLVEVDTSVIIKDDDGQQDIYPSKIRFDKPICVCSKCYYGGKNVYVKGAWKCWNHRFNPGVTGLNVKENDFCSFGVDKEIYVEQPYER